MNITETRAVLTLLTTAMDREMPPGLDEIWAATLADIAFPVARAAAIELVKTSPYMPKVAEIRERARLILVERQRADTRRAQIEGRDQPSPDAGRTGAKMVAHVLARLKDAGQDTANGVYLGKERAAIIAEAAAAEWLDRTADEADARHVYSPNGMCKHGQPGGRSPLQSTGKFRCPLCRLEADGPQ